jgi:DNA repair exonuclease SbcCD nuclease subunit
MKSLDKTKPIVFLGDHHGVWWELLWELENKKIRDCYVVSVGDCGIGFVDKKTELSRIQTLNDDFKSRNINFLGIRGNHDDPSYFTGAERIQLSNFELIEDYSVYEHNSKLIQFIGGAISIDRKGRQEGKSYWKGEGLNFEKEKLQKVDVLVTHTAPSWCFPQQFNEMVYGWAKEDDSLLRELIKERSVMDEIFEACTPTLHLYGHFHSSWTEEIDGCKHKLLNINETWSSVY